MSALLLSGAPGSPYTRKMVALLRYRRIAYRLLLSTTGAPALPAAKPPLLPTFYLPGPDGALQAVTDSTPLIRRFEAEFAGRAVVPADPALALVDALLEDFGDEWLTKAMFHYRWTYPADIRKAGEVLACWRGGPHDDAALAATADAVRQRQIPRLRYVGSNPSTGPVIEAGYQRVLLALEDHFRTHRFLMGARPGASDFALYGQLTQLVHFDPTSMALAAEIAPRVGAWVLMMEDLSGLEPTDTDWLNVTRLPDSLKALLRETGRLYVPLLRANAQALQAGQAELQATIDGQPWVQQAFPYQGKCLAWLRRDHQALSAADRARADAVLAGSGCEALFIP
ncbi:MAG: glutathione S-transferase [Proteobacteria bacterium]|jgi:glutathione S-transferase|nr:glutathione S-transferase [Pseudomonadota bacterium]